MLVVYLLSTQSPMVGADVEPLFSLVLSRGGVHHLVGLPSCFDLLAFPLAVLLLTPMSMTSALLVDLRSGDGRQEQYTNRKG
jgi:hypothetical protein